MNGMIHLLGRQSFTGLRDGREVRLCTLRPYAGADKCDAARWTDAKDVAAAFRRELRLREARADWVDGQEVFFIVGKREVGSPVYRAKAEDVAVWDDAEPLVAEQVGKLDGEITWRRRGAWRIA